MAHREKEMEPSTRPGLRAGPSAVSTRIREGERRTLTICRALCARRMKKKAQERRSMKNKCHKTLLPGPNLRLECLSPTCGCYSSLQGDLCYAGVYPESQSPPPVVYYLPDDLDSVHAGSFQIDRVLCYAAVYPESQSPPPVVDAQAPQSCMKPKWNDRSAILFSLRYGRDPRKGSQAHVEHLCIYVPQISQI